MRGYPLEVAPTRKPSEVAVARATSDRGPSKTKSAEPPTLEETDPKSDTYVVKNVLCCAPLVTRS
jgi:hypothetical protein